MPNQKEEKTHSTVYENYSSLVRSVTIVCKDAVYYAVEVREKDEWVTEWSRTVPFLWDKQHRPAGPAFREAAVVQNTETQDWVYVMHPSSLTVGEA